MEYGSSIPQSAENGFQMQGSWIPVTPLKPEQTNRLARMQWLNPGVCVDGLNPGAYSDRLIQDTICQRAVVPSNSISPAAVQFHNVAVADRMPDLNGWRAAAFATQTQVTSLNSYMEALQNAEARWNKMQYAHFLASKDAAATAVATVGQGGNNVASLQPAISYLQTDGCINQQQHSHPAVNLLCMNQVLQGSNPTTSRNTVCQPQMPQYGFPVPYHATYNHNPPTKALSDVVTDGILSFQPDPPTPDRSWRVRTRQPVETIGPFGNARGSHEKENADIPQRGAGISAQANGSIRPDQVLLQLIESSQPAVPSTSIKETPKGNAVFQPSASTGARAYGSIRPSGDQVLLQLMDPSEADVLSNPIKEIPKANGLNTGANGSIRSYSDQVLLQLIDSSPPSVPLTPNKEFPKGSTDDLQPSVGIGTRANGSIRPYSDQVLLQRMDSLHSTIPSTPVKVMPKNNAGSLQPGVGINAQANGCIRPYSDHVLLQRIDSSQAAPPLSQIKEIPNGNADRLQPSVSISAQASGSIRPYSAQVSVQQMDLLQSAVPSTTIREIPKSGADGLQHSISISAQANGSIRPYSDQDQWQAIDSLQPSVPSTPIKQIPRNAEDLQPSGSISTQANGSIKPSSNQILLQPIDSLQPTVPSTPTKEIPNLSYKECLGKISLPTTPSNPVSLNHNKDEHGIDLNKTPQQKPKRKKHRPKVIKEGTAKRTPKPVTPNQAINAEKPPGKRKYVRKAGLKASVAPTSDAKKALNSEDGMATKSCRRALNFNLEDKAQDGHLGMIQVHQDIPSSSTCDKSVASFRMAVGLDVNCDQRAGTNHMLASKSTPQVPQGLEVMMNSPTGIPFDLNHSMNQINDDYSSLLQNVNSCQQPSREQMKDFAMKNYMGFLGTQMNIHHSGHPTQMNQNIQLKETGHRINLINAASDNRPSTGPSIFQNGIQSINEINGNSHAPSVESSQAKRASKRERSHVDAHQRPINLFVRHTLASQCLQRTIQRDEHNGKGSSEDMHFSVNCKKMKADMKHDELKLNEVPSASIRNGSSSVRDVANQFRSSQTSNRSLAPSNLTHRSKKQQNGTSNIVCDTYLESMAGKQYQTGSNIFRETFSLLNAQNGNDLNTIQAPKSSMGFRNIDRKTMGRSDSPVQMDDLTSITTASIEHRHQPQAPIKAALTHKEGQVSNSFSKPHAQMGILVEENYAHKVHPMTSMSLSSTNQVHLQGHKADSHIYHQTSMKSRGTPHVQKPSGLAPSSYCNSKSYNQLILDASCPSQVSAPNSDPVDEIVYKLDKLNINCSNNIIRGQAERALVPYAAEGKIVPYRGRFDPTKKRHPRPKVDLDPETDRVWKLLMWKESSDGTEGMDAEKEKWWEEERRVFRGRADSFIARMHLVQGDRRFSPWKGSVVDSVVGVFLTQNVSDHLSSSAFMALAARFPLQSRSAKHNEGKSRAAEEQDASIRYPDDSNQQIKVPSHMVFNTVSMTTNEVEPFKEMGSTNEFFGSNKSICIKDCSEGKHLVACQIGSPENKTETAFTVTESASLMDPEDRRTMEAVVSPQSFISSQNSTESMVTFRAADRIGLSSDSNSEAEDLMNRLEYNDINSFTPFMELLQMEGANTFKDFFVNGNGNIPYKKNLDAAQREYDKKKQLIGAECWQGSYPSINNTHSNHPQAQLVFSGIESNDSNNHLHTGLVSRPVEFLSVDASGEGSRSSLPSTGSEITEIRNCSYTGKRTNIEAERDKFVVQGKSFSNVQTALAADSCTPCKHPSTTLGAKVYTDFDTSEGSTLMESQTATMRNRTEPNPKGDLSSSKNGPAETGRRGMTKAEKSRAFDWDSLRKQAQCNGPKKERSRSTMDSVDWEAIRCADVKEISNTIRERGMNNMLSERIKDFLNRLVREHGSIDLEWLRDVPPDKVKDYLLSIRGLGLKSVECVRLLTLHHLAFPVDTNVGRICVRLGWVPIQPLPESLQLHLLELYPMLETIQKYLWPRLCKLDQRTLYELHYQMITFGKVFCTKSKPNCNACPMRGECKHFASAFASARLALPGPEERGLVSSAVPVATEQGYKLVINTTLLPPLEQNPRSHVGSGIKQCEPIIEEPATPEPECVDSSESAIEDAFWTEDPDEIPTIRLNLEEFSQNVHNYMQESSEHQDCDMSKALVVLTQEAASIPMPKLKNVSRLRTEHQVYELPDSHPLLAGWDQREPDDPCSYLLAIWTPGETAQSTEPPEICCASQNSGNLCSKKTCFTCNSTRETNAQTVRGTILIPCRTAMRGSFPLNGTYFQVNEVFADHDTSLQPIDIPRAWVWNLPRRTVYFGTSIPTIFKGLTTEEIQQCFWRGFVCVRGFDQKSRAPRPLVARLHFPASKLVRTKKTTAELA